MKINENTSVVDVALNLSGSLAGLPVVVEQLPVGEPVGFDAMPAPGEDVEDIGQTWTPDLQGKEVDLGVPVYNPSAQQKEPYTTNMSEITPVIAEGEEMINGLLSGEDGRKIIRVSDLPVGFNLRGCKIHFTMTHLRPTAKKGQQNIWYGITAAWDKGVTYKGSLLRHYTDKIAKPNTLTFFTEYYINIDVSRNTQIVYMDDDGWQTDVIEFSIEHDCIVTSNTCNLESFEPGAWNWNYAYVEAYQFPKVKKSVADIPVGYNLRNKTIYFHGAELQRDFAGVGSVLESTGGDGKTYNLINYSTRPNRSYGIGIEVAGSLEKVFYLDYSNTFKLSKYTFPDIDIIVTKNELSKIRSKGFFWGFDYAKISDDSTLPAPTVPLNSLTRPYFRYLNAIPCNLDNWIPWRTESEMPVLTPEKWIRFTTDGKINTLNGGGVFNTLLFTYNNASKENIVLNGNIVIVRAIARTQGPPNLQLAVCVPNDTPITAIKQALTTNFKLIEGQLTYNVATSANSVLIAKGYGDATPGTYDVQAIEVLVYKLPPNGNKSKENSVQAEVHDWTPVDQ